MKQIGRGSLLIIFVVLVLGLSNSSFAQDTSNSDQTKSTPQNRPLKVKKRPFATSRGGDDIDSGAIVLRVTFDRSGEITDVEVISRSGCSLFDKSAINAAKGIKFEPEIKNGEAVTVVRKVVFTFQIH